MMHNAHKGQFHPRAVLTDQQVELMRRLHEVDGWSYAKLVEKFDISKTQVGRICRYEQR